MKDDEQIIKDSIDREELIQATLSDPFASSTKKIEIRPVKIKDQTQYQITEYVGQKALHKNCSPSTFKNILFVNYLTHFKQALIRLKDSDYQILTNKKGKRTFIRKSREDKSLPILSHNRKKNYILEDGTTIPFLIELGIMGKDGKILAKKMDKYRQLNRFLEMVEDVLPALKHKKTIRIIDFGCGKAYLTFALYHYLHNIKGFDLQMTGLDLKEDVVAFCENLSRGLKFQGLSFLKGDINDYETKGDVDLVVTLHACDTATDAALEKAVLWGTSVILSVPCCQHELFSQVKNPILNPLLKHGILKERFASLVTDAVRAQILEILGYQTQILEFIDMEHTPKNLLIRAIKKEKLINKEQLLEEYKLLKNELNITPSLEKIIKKYI